MITALTPKNELPKGANDGYMPHVLLVVDQFQRVLGGGERIALKLAALLPQYGYRASILTFAADPECAALSDAKCPVYLLPLERTYDFTALRAALEFGRFLRRQQVQIVQTFFESSDLWAGGVAKALSDAKLIWSRRDMGILRGSKHSIAYRLLANVPDAVLAVSGQVRQHAIQVDGIAPDRVFTVYNGLELRDWECGARCMRASGDLVVATLGNIRRVKGHDLLVRAAAPLVAQFPRVKFRVAGDVLDPAYFAELQQLVSDLNLTEHFQFVGGVKDLRSYLADADIFVLPSRSEGFSNAIVEAMAVGLPVVATDVGGNAEAVKDGVSGLIVPSEDAGALSKALATILADPGKAAQMGAAGKEIVEERFTIAAMMSGVTEIYSRVLA